MSRPDVARLLADLRAADYCTMGEWGKDPIDHRDALIEALEGRGAALREHLFVAVARYEMDEPHWEDDTTDGTVVDLDGLNEWLESKHDGDCTGQPHTCLRCMAEHWQHKAEWLADVVEEAA